MSLHRPRKGRQQHDPFGPDGFGDDWDSTPTVRTFARDSEEWPLDDPNSMDRCDWGSAATSRRQQQAEKDAKQKKRQVARARMLKKKAAFEAAAVGASMQQQAEEDAAKKAAWNREVERATECIALADPVQALNILHSLSLNTEIVHHVDAKEKENVGQLYAALYNHYELLKSLPSTLANYYYLDQSSSGLDQSNLNNDAESTCSTTGGDTVKVNLSVDRPNLSSEDESSIDVDRPNLGSKDESSIDDCSDAAPINQSPSDFQSNREDEDEDDCESETGKTVVVVDFGGQFSVNRNVNHIVTEQMNAVDHFMQQALDLLESIMQQHGDRLKAEAKHAIKQRISVAHDQQTKTNGTLHSMQKSDSSNNNLHSACQKWSN